MRKDEYLNCMAQELKQYDKAYVDEIIGDYEEHFREGMEMGKSEEDICAELGAVKDLVEEIKEMMQEMMGTDCQCEFQVGRTVNEELIESELVDSEDGEECFVEAGLTGLKRINFSAGAADIAVIPSRDDRFYVYTENPDDGKYLVHKRRGEEYCGGVKREKKSGSLGAQIWSVISAVLTGLIGKITLEVPGNIEELLINTTSGAVVIKDIKCKELRVNCTSGDVSVKETEGQKILLIANNGDAKFHHVKAEKLEIKSVNGDLGIKDVTGKEISANSVNGDIHGNKLEAEIVNAKAVSGDIKLKLKCHGESFYAYTKTVRGDINLKNGYQVTLNDMQRADMENKVKVTACTVSGDITISGE